jgi:hypothetical protein
MIERPGIGFWFWMSVLATVIAGCIYMIVLGIQADDRTGPWLFAAFGFFFIIPFFFGLFRIAAMNSPGLESLYNKYTGADRLRDTRFAPHWFMLIAAIILIGATMYGIIMAIASLFR